MTNFSYSEVYQMSVTIIFENELFSIFRSVPYVSSDFIRKLIIISIFEVYHMSVAFSVILTVYHQIRTVPNVGGYIIPLDWSGSRPEAIAVLIVGLNLEAKKKKEFCMSVLYVGFIFPNFRTLDCKVSHLSVCPICRYIFTVPSVGIFF